MRRRVLVTGANGSVGYELIRQLISEYDIVAVGRSFNNLFEFKDSIVMHNSDICDMVELSKGFKDIDYVVHLAAMVHNHSNKVDPKEYYRINTDATEHIFKLCLENNVKKVIFCSTVAVYGKSSSILNEESVVNPITHYAKSKMEAENIGMSMVNKYGLPLIIFRPATMYGNLDRGNYKSLISLCRKGISVIPGSGDNCKPLIYVKDVAAAVLKAINSDVKTGEIFNISEANYKLADIIEYVEKAFDINTFKMRIPNYIIDFSRKHENIYLLRKIRTLTESIEIDNNRMIKYLGVKPEYNLINGLKDCKDYYKRF